MIDKDICSFQEIDHAWNGKMLQILRDSPVESGGLTICFDKSPDVFLIPELKAEHYKCVGFFVNKELVGFAMLTFYKAYVNGAPRVVMYFCNMYINKKGRGNQFYFKASDFLYKNPYKHANLGYSLVMKGNRAAESYIGKRDPKYKHLPYSRSIGRLAVKNLIITFPKKESRHIHVRQAKEADISNIVTLLQEEFRPRLFAPVINEARFRKNLADRPAFNITNYYVAEKDTQMIGVCAVWDTLPLRQNRIIKFSSKLAGIRFIYQILAFLFRFPPLPKEGEFFKDATITEYAVTNRDPAVMKVLLSKIYNDYRKKKYNLIIFGSCDNDPLLNATRAFFHTTILSNIVMASSSEKLLVPGMIDCSLPYIDVATI